MVLQFVIPKRLLALATLEPGLVVCNVLGDYFSDFGKCVCDYNVSGFLRTAL